MRSIYRRGASFAAFLVLLALLLSHISCGKKDAIRETREILEKADNFTFITVIEDADGAGTVAEPYAIYVTADVILEDSIDLNGSEMSTYTILGEDRVTLWRPWGEEQYLPGDSWSREEFTTQFYDQDSAWGRFLSYLDEDAWRWERTRDAFVPRDLTMFRALGVTVTDMELTITGGTCNLMGRGTVTLLGEAYDVIITMHVSDIGMTEEICLPASITAAAQ